MRMLILSGRWLCVPLAFVLLLLAGAWAGERLVRVLDGYCAPEALAAGVCVASWHTTAIEWVVAVGLFVTVPLAIVIPSRLAPAGRRVTATVCAILLTALPVTVWLGLGWTDFLMPAGVAGLAAVAGARWVWRWRARA